MCPAEEKEVFQCLAVGIHLGGGEQGHFQPELVRSSLKRKKEAICPESRRAMELLTATAHCDTGLPPVTIKPRRRSFYPQDQHREQISDLDLKGVKRQTGRRLGSNPHSIWPSECGKQRSQEQQRVAQLTARCQPPPTSVTPPACLVLS